MRSPRRTGRHAVDDLGEGVAHSQPGQLLVTYTAEPDSGPTRALVELAALAEDMVFAGDA